MTAATTTVFGSSIKRREDPKLITGQGTYVDDIKLVGMLHAAIVRSPHAHARILNVDTSRAKNRPRVVAVFTGAELQEELGELILGWIVPGQKHTTHRVPMASGKVRFVGESIAAVVAEDPASASYLWAHTGLLTSRAKSMAPLPTPRPWMPTVAQAALRPTS